jgi:2-dehydro-3-deoxyphosphogluconate aldolase/(4S)-4-hydroxy-2-oxoglutarate aldolase
MPGALTPTEVVTAWSAGADMVKVFPCGALGALYIKSLKAPLPQIELVPTVEFSKYRGKFYRSRIGGYWCEADLVDIKQFAPAEREGDG